MANVFQALENDNDETWNTARRIAINSIERQSNKTIATEALSSFENSDIKQSQSTVYNSVLSDIKSTLIKGKKLKRADFLHAVKKAEDIQKVLGEATAEETSLHPKLLELLAGYVETALHALGKGTPNAITAGTKAVGNKMAASAGGFLKGMVSQATQGIPFAPELVELTGAKIKDVFTGRGVSEGQKEMASMLGGVGTGEGTGGGTGGGDNGGGNGGDNDSGDNGSGGGLGGQVVIEKLDSIIEHLKQGFGLNSPPYLQTLTENFETFTGNMESPETRREEERESDRQHAETIEAMKKAGGIGAAGAAGAGAGGDDGLGWFDLLMFDSTKDWLNKKGGMAEKGKGMLKKAGLGLLSLLNPFKKAFWIMSGIAAVGVGLASLFSGGKIRSKVKDDELQSHAKGVVDVKKDHLAMIHEGEVVLDNKAALDFKEGAKVLGGIASHAKGLAGPLDDKDDKEGWITPEKDWWKSQYQKETEGLEWWKNRVKRKGLSKIRAESDWMDRVDRYGLKDARKTPSELRAEGEYAIDVSRYGKEETDRRKRLGLTKADLKAESEAYSKSMEWPGKSKTTMETLEHLQKNFGVELMNLHDFVGGATVEEMKKQGYIGQMYIPSKFSDAVNMLGYLGDGTWKGTSDKESKWAKGLEEVHDIFSMATTSTVLHQLAGVKSWQQLKQVRDDTTKKEEEFSEALYALGIDFDAGKSKLHKATREEGGRLYAGLQGRMKRGDNPLFNAMQNVESMNLSQLLDLQHAIKNYAKTRESVKIAEGHMLAKEAVWGGDISGLLGSDKDRFTTEFGKNYSATNTLRAKGTGLGMTNPLKSLLAESSAAVQKLIGGSAIYKSTDASVYDARNFQKAIPRAQYGMGVAGSGMIFADKGEEVLEKAEVATIAQALAGNQLNNAAKDKIGLGGQRGTESANVFDSSTIVNNNTQIIPNESPEPTGQLLPGAGRDVGVSHFRHVA